MSHGGRNESGPPPLSRTWALFLDVDGTLLEIAPHPAQVRVPPGLRERLSALSRSMEGALALVSGRTLHDLDGLFAPLRLPAVGMHGVERRDAAPPAVPEALRATKAAAEPLRARHPGVVVEDKGAALALHWRMAPEAEPSLRALAGDAMRALPGYRLQQGDCVVELRPGGADKGGAIAGFMRAPPFHGRTPVFVGDDVTDEDGFAFVEAHGGFGVLVGARAPTQARHRLHDVAAVHRWLGVVP